MSSTRSLAGGLALVLLVLSLAVGQEQTAQGSLERGLELYKKRNFRGALEEFAKLAEAEPARADLHYLMGYSHYMLKHYQEALDAFGKAFQADPKFDPRSIFKKPASPPSGP